MPRLIANLAVTGLSDVSYAFYNASEAIIGSAITSGIIEGQSGFYGVNVSSYPSGAVTARFQSASNTYAFATIDLQDFPQSGDSYVTASRLGTMLVVGVGGNYLFTSGALANIPSSGTLTMATATALNNAAQVVFTSLLQSGTTPLTALPAINLTGNQCQIAGYILNVDGSASVNTTVTVSLNALTPAKCGGVLAKRSVAAQTNSSGYFSITADGNDRIIPAGSTYTITCDAVAFVSTPQAISAGTTLDVSTLIE